MPSIRPPMPVRRCDDTRAPNRTASYVIARTGKSSSTAAHHHSRPCLPEPRRPARADQHVLPVRSPPRHRQSLRARERRGVGPPSAVTKVEGAAASFSSRTRRGESARCRAAPISTGPPIRQRSASWVARPSPEVSKMRLRVAQDREERSARTTSETHPSPSLRAARPRLHEHSAATMMRRVDARMQDHAGRTARRPTRIIARQSGRAQELLATS